ncbi:uncharacterized protein PHACADRAFT_172188 [Phanerochaete carnosa HHB-10118-sp]|uniref:Uncharacterized protein n=1 Tax=Phanerochaete carnosa (strain HHB-10118-sp) TaxID=650164 RepID=K5WBC7_PHACS|nr:uncharacterized protein PHACADRAFT_172188 [Phanerochaete carnosa HHB-10118-sp]EKM56505.1 hypothetical protein PHACADRAFT_172188 [Phanerochaete carnosa HHB-10118-sp]
MFPAVPSAMSAPARRAIPTFAPPPPDSSSSTTPLPISLPGSILSISPTSSDTSSPTPTDTQQTSPPTTPTSSAASASSDTATAGTGTADSTSASTTSSSSSMSSQSSSAVLLPSSLSPSPSPTSSISPVAATSHSNHAGAIAGGVIGGVAFVVLLIGAVLFALRRHNKRQTQQDILPWSSGGLGRRRGNVRISSSSGLTGADLGVGNSNSGYGFAKRMSELGYPVTGDDYINKNIGGAEPHRHASTASSAGMLPHTHPASVSSHTHVNVHSSENVAGYSDDEEKNSTLHHYDSSSYSHGNKSVDLTDLAIPHLPMEPPSAFSHQERNRSRSVTGQNRALALAKLDPFVSIVPAYSNINPTGGASISRSPSAATYSSQKDPFASPTDKSLHRLSSSGGVSRRPTITRKAVPKYDESEFSMADMSSPISRPTSPIYTTSPPPIHRQPSPASPSGAHVVAAHAVSPYALSRESSNDSMRDRSRAGLASLPALNHKTSFGDIKPVHYLIPDMPPPPQD